MGTLQVCCWNYAAPEMLIGGTRYDERADIWSAAAILIECIIGTNLVLP